MGQSAAVLCESILMLCVASGCAAKPMDQSLVTFEPFTGFRAVASSRETSTPVADSPFKPSRSKSASEDDVEVAGADRERIDTDEGDAEQVETADSRLLAFDSSTQSLIEKELEDATPAERDELLDDLEGVDAGMVRQVLKIRRMMARSLEQLESGHSQVAQTDFQDRSELPRLDPEMPGGKLDNTIERYRSSQPMYESTPQLAMAEGYTYPGYSTQLPPAAQPPVRQPVVPTNHNLMAQNPYPSPTPTQPTYEIRPSQPAAGFGHSPAMQSPQNGYNVQPGHSTGGYPPASAQLPLNTPPGSPGHFGPNPDFRAQPRVAPSPNSAASITPNSGYPQTANPQPTSALGSAMGTLGSAYSAVMSNFPRREVPQPQGASLSNILQPTGPGDPIGNQFNTSAYSPTSYSAAPPDFGRELNQMIDIAASDAARIPPGATREQQQQYIQKQVQLRMLYLMAGHQERALEAIPSIDPADQEFWQQVFWSLANYFDTDAMPDSSDRATQTIAQLRSAVLRLQESARLEIRNVNFCHKINSYGDYERFQRDEFTPGQPVLVYAEVENFKSDPTSDGRFRTLLRSTVDIHKAGDGGLIQSIPFQATEDLCRNHRRDYFHSYEFTIPQRISLGPHVMKLTLEDQLSRKVATYSLNFTVR